MEKVPQEGHGPVAKGARPNWFHCRFEIKLQQRGSTTSLAEQDDTFRC